MEREFIELGLGNYESKILNALINKSLNLRELSQKSGVPFGKIYSVVKNLIKKDLVMETNTRPKLVYIENASELIKKLMREKDRSHAELRKHLINLASTIDKNKGRDTPFFEIGTTIKDNMKIQLRTFNEAEKEVLQILNVYHKPNSNRKSKTIWEKSIAKAISRGVKFKCIYPELIQLPEMINKFANSKDNSFQIKRYNTYFTRCDIVDSKKVLLKLVQEDPIQFGGVIFIEDESLARNLKNIFNGMWENC